MEVCKHIVIKPDGSLSFAFFGEGSYINLSLILYNSVCGISTTGVSPSRKQIAQFCKTRECKSLYQKIINLQNKNALLVLCTQVLLV